MIKKSILLFLTSLFLFSQSIYLHHTKKFYHLKINPLKLEFFFENKNNPYYKVLIELTQQVKRKFDDFFPRLPKKNWKVSIGSKPFIPHSIFIPEKSLQKITRIELFLLLNNHLIKKQLGLKPNHFLSSILVYRNLKNQNNLLDFHFIKKFYERNLPLKIHNFFLIKNPTNSLKFYQIYTEIAYFLYFLLSYSPEQKKLIENWSEQSFIDMRIFFSTKSPQWFLNKVESAAYSSAYPLPETIVKKNIDALFQNFIDDKQKLKRKISKKQALILRQRIQLILLKSSKKTQEHLDELLSVLKKLESFWSGLFFKSSFTKAYKRFTDHLNREIDLINYLNQWEKEYSSRQNNPPTPLKEKNNQYSNYLKKFEKNYSNIINSLYK